MQITRNGSRPSDAGPAAYFTGRVRRDPIIEAPAPARVAADPASEVRRRAGVRGSRAVARDLHFPSPLPRGAAPRDPSLLHGAAIA